MSLPLKSHVEVMFTSESSHPTLFGPVQHHRRTVTNNKEPGTTLLDPKTLAAYLGIPVATLYDWRRKRIGPPGIRVGKHIRYRSRDVEAWLEIGGRPSDDYEREGLTMASIDKIPTGWRARWRTADGASRSKNFERKADAEDCLTDIAHSQRVGAYVDPRKGKLLFGQFVEEGRGQAADATTSA